MMRAMIDRLCVCAALALTLSACNGDRVTLDGTTLQVSASGSYTVPGGNPICATVCTPVAATCSSEPLAAGTYTVEYAGESANLVVPSMDGQVEVGTGCVP